MCHPQSASRLTHHLALFWWAKETGYSGTQSLLTDFSGATNIQMVERGTVSNTGSFMTFIFELVKSIFNLQQISFS